MEEQHASTQSKTKLKYVCQVKMVIHFFYKLPATSCLAAMHIWHTNWKDYVMICLQTFNRSHTFSFNKAYHPILIIITQVFNLTTHNWQNWKVLLSCYCHEIYMVEVFGLRNSNHTWKIAIAFFSEFVKFGTISWKIDIFLITA